MNNKNEEWDKRSSSNNHIRNYAIERNRQIRERLNKFDEIKFEVSNEVNIISHNKVLESLLNEIQQIDFQEETMLPYSIDLRKKHYITITIDQILKVATKNKWSLCVNDGMVYIFNGAFWSQLSKQELAKFLGQAAEKLGVDKFDATYYSFKDELVKQFMSAAYFPKPTNENDEILVNLQNGTLVISLENQIVREFDKKDFLTYQLSFKMNPAAECTLFKNYLNKVLPDESQQKILAEFIGYVFVKHSTLKLEKALILYGVGANGKSVFFEIITALLGTQNISNYSLQSLTNETGYYRATLSNKLLNYASEISPRMDSTLFKQLVSGEPVEARLPYGEPFMLHDYAKLIFNANELPKDVEHNEAFFRRFIILHFGITIPENERDPFIAKNIISSELSGVLNWVLEGLRRLLDKKGFSHSEAVDLLLKNYREQSDSVQLFILDHGYIKDSIKEVPLKEIYANYKGYCIENGYVVCSAKTFGERLRNKGFEIKRKNAGKYVYAAKKTFLEASPGTHPAQLNL